MEGRRDHRIQVVLITMAMLAIGLPAGAEEKPPPLDTPPTTVVYTTPDSAVVEAEKGPSAAPANNVVNRKKSNCHLEAVGTEGEVPGLGQVSIPAPEDKKAYWVMCDGQSVGMIWLPIKSGSAPKPSTPGDIAERLRSEIPMPQVSIRMNPSVGLVGNESWFWIEGYGGDAISNNTDAFGSLVEVEARPTSYEWSFGDGSTLTGDSTGRPYPERSEIRHVFERAASDGYQVTVRFVFEVRFRTNGGAWIDLPGITRTASTAYTVRESQAVISR